MSYLLFDLCAEQTAVPEKKMCTKSEIPIPKI